MHQHGQATKINICGRRILAWRCTIHDTGLQQSAECRVQSALHAGVIGAMLQHITKSLLLSQFANTDLTKSPEPHGAPAKTAGPRRHFFSVSLCSSPKINRAHPMNCIVGHHLALQTPEAPSLLTEYLLVPLSACPYTRMLTVLSDSPWHLGSSTS